MVFYDGEKAQIQLKTTRFKNRERRFIYLDPGRVSKKAEIRAGTEERGNGQPLNSH